MAGGYLYDGDYVDLRDLRFLDGTEFSGGSAVLRRCDLRGRQYLLKRYRPEYLVQVNPEALGRLVAWRDSLDAGDRDRLDALTSWPRHRVRDRSGALCGVLIPEAAARFMQLTRWGQRKPRDLSKLIRLNVGGNVRDGASSAAKRVVLGRVAELVLWLHAHGIIVNDLQAENILCSGDAGAVYLLDCDTTIGPWGRVCPPQAPEYVRAVVPDADSPTAATDLARLAWLAVWLLLDRFEIIDLHDRAIRDPAGGDEYGKLLIHTARAAGGGPPPIARWRRLASAWITGDPDPLAGPATTQPGAALSGAASPGADPAGPVMSGEVIDCQRAVPREPEVSYRHWRRSYEWVPNQFQRPRERVSYLAEPPTDPLAEPDPAMSPRVSRVSMRLLIAAALILTGLLVLFEIVYQVVRR